MGLLRNSAIALGLIVLAASGMTGGVLAQTPMSQCSVLSGRPCHPTFCGVFHRGPCMPYNLPPIGASSPGFSAVGDDVVVPERLSASPTGR